MEALLGGDTTALDEAERRGVLEADPGHVWFRHELARASSGGAPPRPGRLQPAGPGRARPPPGVELSRLSHHAHQAGDPEAVVRHGLAAAREAAGAGAFTEALAHYELVLRWSGQLPDTQRATVLEESVWVLYNLSRFDERWPAPHEVVALSGPATRPRSGRPSPPCRGCATW